MQNVFVLGLERYSRDLTKIRCGIRDLTATCEAGFAKVGQKDVGLGKKNIFGTAMTKVRDAGFW